MHLNKLRLGLFNSKRFYLLLSLLLVSVWTHADISRFKWLATIDQVEGHGFSLEGIKLSLDASFKDNSSYEVKIVSAILPDNKRIIKDISFICHTGKISEQEISCVNGEISFKDPFVIARSAPISFQRNNNGNFSLKVDEIQLAGGQASIAVDMQQENWEVQIDTQNVLLSKLNSIRPNLFELSLSGNLQSSSTIVGNGTKIQALDSEATINDLAFTNQESTIVGEGVAVKLSFNSNRNQLKWENQFSSTVFGGELYFDPIFIDANVSPKDIHGKIIWDIETNNLELKPLHFEDQNVTHLNITTLLDIEQKKPITPIQLNIDYAVLPEAYLTYMQPFLLDTNLADLDTKGSITGSMEINGSRIRQTNFNFNRVTFIDNQKRYALTNLDGEFGWGDKFIDRQYEIGFESADIYKLRLGQTEFSFFNHDEVLKLNNVVTVPILDGSLNIESFTVNYPGEEEQEISLDLSLTPISMYKVSSLFEWPEMNGNLAGYAPNVVYKQGNVDVQGALLIRAFDGTTTIHNLKARNLFSVTPRIIADIQIQNLDLSSLTETFSFGEITGKLGGYINNLQLVSWKPTRFDAWLGTPENDKSKHRISQKAVDNLTQVGNGASNIFSRSFLRFLESFGYDRLGIGCRLKNTTCKMRGVTASDQGFYIVKGSGVPRIDIIGFTDEVSWPVLTARLKRVVSTQDVVVQ